jgi:hypothetical protein
MHISYYYYVCKFASITSLSFLVWPLLPTHCRCRGLLLHLITLHDTHARTHTHTHTHTHTVRLLSKRDGRVANACTSTTHNTHTRNTSTPTPLPGSEPAIPASKRSQTYPWYRMTLIILHANRIFALHYIRSHGETRCLRLQFRRLGFFHHDDGRKRFRNFGTCCRLQAVKQQVTKVLILIE